MNIKYVLRCCLWFLFPFFVPIFFCTFISDYVQFIKLPFYSILVDDLGFMLVVTLVSIGLWDWLHGVCCSLRALWSWLRQRLSK